MKIANNLIISAGLIIINNDKKILLIKPKGLDIGHFSLPKGIKEKRETLKQTAIRETFEETGIRINEDKLGKQFVINYYNKEVLTKRVFCYLVSIDFNLESPKYVQNGEVDFYNFYTYEEANKIIFWRYKSLLTTIWK